MEIVNTYIPDSEIEIIEYHGDLAGRDSLQLADFLYTSLDEGKRYEVINLKHVRKADGLGLMVLEYFINRGMQIRLFNTGLEVQNLLRLSGKDAVIKTYDCFEQDEAISQFEKEVIGDKDKADSRISGRRFTRINASFKIEFKYTSAHDGEILSKAVIRDISEGGVSTEQITAFSAKTAKTINALKMVGKELSGVKFSLNGASSIIETVGKCVWETGVHDNRSAGIRFGDMSRDHKKMINKYLCKQRV